MYKDIPVKVYEEKYQVYAKAYEALSHIVLQLLSVVDFRGIKHTDVTWGLRDNPETEKQILCTHTLISLKKKWQHRWS